MVFPIILLSISFLAVTYFCYEKVKAYSLKAVLIKTVCSLLFIALATYSIFKTGYHYFSPFAILALVVGMLGDIFLEMKYVFKEKDREFTYAGFIAFGLGHILYITGLFLEFYRQQNVLYTIMPFVFGLLMAVICLLIEKPFKLEYKSYKYIVFIYALSLFSDLGVTFSFFLMSSFQSTSLIMIFAGMALFALSDLVLNNTYFGEGHEKPIDLVSNTFMYYVAQNLIAFAIFFL